MQGGTVGHDIKIWRDIIGNCSEVTLDMDAQSALHFVKHDLKSNREKFD